MGRLNLSESYSFKKIVNKIQKHQGFNHSGGRADVAIRTSGRKYVWDGLRRCMKAGICGLPNIAVTRTKHLPQLTELECRREEPLWFKMRGIRYRENETRRGMIEKLFS